MKQLKCYRPNLYLTRYNSPVVQLRPSQQQCVLVAQSYLTLCDPMGYNPPGFFVHGILWARILKWVALPFSRASSQPGIEPQSAALQVDSLPAEPTGKPQPATKVLCNRFFSELFINQSQQSLHNVQNIMLCLDKHLRNTKPL